MEEIKNIIEDLLKSTGIEGVGKLLEHMEKEGFYTAPCSSQYHLCYEGGLAEHSLNVYSTMESMGDSLGYLDIHHDIAICGLLHDIGKMGLKGQPYYVPNILTSGKVSDKKPWETNKALAGIPHEVLSVTLISQFITLTEKQYNAILFHNGLYTSLGQGIKGKETDLYLLLHSSDMWCSRIIEKED